MMEDNPEDRVDPMARIFPKVTIICVLMIFLITIPGQVTKCTFNKFGPTGTLMRRDALCVLPVNIINEVRNYEINSKLVCEDSTITEKALLCTRAFLS